MDIAGRKILITGATRGIGRQLAAKLAARGARLVLAARDADRLAAVQADIRGQADIVACDLSRFDATDALARRITDEHPDLSILVNNAAAQTEMDFVHGQGLQTVCLARSELAVNLAAPVALISALMPVLRGQPSAAIINITTALALAPKKASPVYCASKAGLRNFTQALRYQCADDAPHVRVCEVIMTLVDTEMTRGRNAEKMAPDAAAEAIMAGITSDRGEVWVGKTRFLPALARLSRKTLQRILR